MYQSWNLQEAISTICTPIKHPCIKHFEISLLVCIKMYYAHQLRNKTNHAQRLFQRRFFICSMQQPTLGLITICAWKKGHILNTKVSHLNHMLSLISPCRSMLMPFKTMSWVEPTLLWYLHISYNTTKKNPKKILLDWARG